MPGGEREHRVSADGVLRRGDVSEVGEAGLQFTEPGGAEKRRDLARQVTALDGASVVKGR